MLQPTTLKFLKDLTKNNNKPWFDAHRSAYETAKGDFAKFVQEIIDKHGKKDPEIKHLLAKDCTFRINRDIRFSKNKTPYKNNFGASFSKGGKKSKYAGYYFHFSPGDSFAGGGIWMPEPEDLKKVRQEIDYNYKEFKKIVTAKKFKAVYGDLSHEAEYTLSRLPKGYEPGNPAEEYLKMKSYIAMIAVPDKDLGKDLVKKTLTAFEALQPLVEFLNDSMD